MPLRLLALQLLCLPPSLLCLTPSLLVAPRLVVGEDLLRLLDVVPQLLQSGAHRCLLRARRRVLNPRRRVEGLPLSRVTVAVAPIGAVGGRHRVTEDALQPRCVDLAPYARVRLVNNGTGHVVHVEARSVRTSVGGERDDARLLTEGNLIQPSLRRIPANDAERHGLIFERRQVITASDTADLKHLDLARMLEAPLRK